MTGALSADELFRKHADELLAFATGLVGRSDAADIVSAAFVAALSGRNWEMVDNRRAYLYRCVQNEARRLYRSRSRRAVRERRAAAPHSVEDRDPRPDVVAAVRNLSFRQKGVVFLTYWTGMTPPEVAAALGIGEGSVRRHLARARARLREVLDE